MELLNTTTYLGQGADMTQEIYPPSLQKKQKNRKEIELGREDYIYSVVVLHNGKDTLLLII